MALPLSTPFLLANILKSNFSKRPNLYKLNLFLTYRCNFKCKTCFIWRKKSANELSAAEYSKIFSKINVNWIDVSGGEIFLRQDLQYIFSIIMRSQKRLALLHFPTNGFFTDKIYDLVSYILRHSKAKLVVTVSLDGPAATHNLIKGADSWQASVDTYKKLKTIKNGRFRVFLGYTLSDFNHDQIGQTLAKLKEEIAGIHYGDIHINIVHRSPHYYDNESLELDKNAIKESVGRYINERIYRLGSPIDYLEKRYHSLIKKYLVSGKTPLVCRSLINNIFIDPQGNIFPCSIYNKKIGNLRDSDYDLNRILGSKEAEIIREEIKSGQCPQCWSPCEAYPMILASLIKK